MCRSGLPVSSAILFAKEERKVTLKSRKDLTNSVNYELDDGESESEFYYPESNNNKNNNIENDNSLTLYVCIRCVV